MLRTAVVGTGYLGAFHAQKYSQLPASLLVGVADINPSQGQKVAGECNTTYFPDHKALLDKVDAVSIAVPTCMHHAIARDFLEAGVHVLVEKPITTTVAEAKELVSLAHKKQLVLQVGFLERFNAAIDSVIPELVEPRFIESHRLAGFKPRSIDINVVMDLMIHDLDIILSLVDSPVINIVANGTPVLTNTVDIAQARLTFNNGCVANVTASRISQNSKRKMHIFQKTGCICVDFQELKTRFFSKGDNEVFPGIPTIQCQEQQFRDDDPLKKEIDDFLQCITCRRSPKASGEQGAKALDIACQISNIIAQGQY
ncbi:Gfo/Idh/MocA family oxidoreductase [Candidatus Sororendozoicomonas aggregata]|uniref:Gfo/Idh/MocA family protein n=1 Tax=Candidatus Sororendozoicomonas aggregata TaxID=3073239 RepID=UPI002ED07B14